MAARPKISPMAARFFAFAASTSAFMASSGVEKSVCFSVCFWAAAAATPHEKPTEKSAMNARTASTPFRISNNLIRHAVSISLALSCLGLWLSPRRRCQKRRSREFQSPKSARRLRSLPPPRCERNRRNRWSCQRIGNNDRRPRGRLVHPSPTFLSTLTGGTRVETGLAAEHGIGRPLILSRRWLRRRLRAWHRSAGWRRRRLRSLLRRGQRRLPCWSRLRRSLLPRRGLQRRRSPTVGVKSRISHVQIASDDLVARVGIAGVVSLVPRQVVVIHVAMNAVVAVEVDVVDVPANDISVDLDVGIAIIHVDVGDPDDRAATGDPAAAPPPMIVNTTRVPVAVVVQPRPDRERRTEKDDAGWRQAVIGGRAEINHIRVVRRDVDVLRLRGNDIEKVAVHIHLLLLVRDEI